MKNVESRKIKKQKIDVTRRTEDLSKQFDFVKNLIHQWKDDFFVEVEDSLNQISKVDVNNKPLKTELSKVRLDLRKSASDFEDQIGNLLDSWRQEISAGVNSPYRYGSKAN